MSERDGGADAEGEGRERDQRPAETAHAADYNPRMHRHLAVTVVALFALSASFFAQMPRRDGKWEVKMEMDLPGMPQGMQPITTTQCITPDMVKDPNQAIPQSGRGGRGLPERCKVSDYKIDGNKVTWSMACEPPPQAMTGSGEMTYSGDTYTGVVNVNTGGRSMTMKYSGKRLGDCDQK